MGKIFIAAASIEGFLASGSHSMKYMQNVLKNGRSLGTACLSCQKKTQNRSNSAFSTKFISKLDSCS